MSQEIKGYVDPIEKDVNDQLRVMYINAVNAINKKKSQKTIPLDASWEVLYANYGVDTDLKNKLLDEIDTLKDMDLV